MLSDFVEKQQETASRKILNVFILKQEGKSWLFDVITVFRLFILQHLHVFNFGLIFFRLAFYILQPTTLY